mgnify:CR=1 FL=1
MEVLVDGSTFYLKVFDVLFHSLHFRVNSVQLGCIWAWLGDHELHLLHILFLAFNKWNLLVLIPPKGDGVFLFIFLALKNEFLEVSLQAEERPISIALIHIDIFSQKFVLFNPFLFVETLHRWFGH